MKKTTIIAAAALAAAGALRGDIEFTGFMHGSGRGLYSLRDTEDKTSSGWMRIGETFRGYTIESFDPDRETVVLRNSGKSVERRLRDSKVANGNRVIFGTIRVGAETDGGIRAALYPGEESSFPVKDGVTLFLQIDPLPDGMLNVRSRFVVAQDSGEEKVITIAPFVARPGVAFGAWEGDLRFSFRP